MNGQMDGYTHTDIPFPQDRLNGKESQRRRALKREVSSVSRGQSTGPEAAELRLRLGFAT